MGATFEALLLISMSQKDLGAEICTLACCLVSLQSAPRGLEVFVLDFLPHLPISVSDP